MCNVFQEPRRTRAARGCSGHQPVGLVHHDRRSEVPKTLILLCLLVRKGGFEPPRSCERQPLKHSSEAITSDQANVYRTGSVNGKSARDAGDASIRTNSHTGGGRATRASRWLLLIRQRVRVHVQGHLDLILQHVDRHVLVEIAPFVTYLGVDQRTRPDLSKSITDAAEVVVFAPVDGVEIAALPISTSKPS